MFLSALILVTTLLTGPPFDGKKADCATTSEHRSVNLSQIDSIRVLLFHRRPAHSAEIWAWNGALTITTQHGDTLRLKPGQPAVRIVRSGRNVFCISGQRRLIARWLTITAQPDTLIRIKSPDYSYRYYRGMVRFSAGRSPRMLHIVNKTSLEDYVGSVVGSEMEFTNIETLKVQAVIARTYALWHLSKTTGYDYDVSDNTENQQYKGDLIMKPYCRQVALATKGEIITWSHRLILAAYSSTCGGQTASNQAVWGGAPIPYLQPVKDNGACADSPHYRWTYRIDRESLLHALRDALHKPVIDIGAFDTTQYGRITNVHLKISPGHTRTIRGNRFREILLKRFGERSLKSNWYTLQKVQNMYIFHGRGMGHGVGLCQWGARGLALSGWHYRDILRFYYTGVQIEELDHIKERNLPLAY